MVDPGGPDAIGGHAEGGASGSHLGMEISEQNGEGEGTMTTFIQAHFASILRPFADHVEELHRSFSRLDADLAEAGRRGKANSAQLEEHAALLVSLQSNLKQTTKQAGTTQAGLEACNSEKAQLEADCARIKADLANSDVRLGAAEGAVANLQQGLKGTRSSVSKLREGLSKTDRDLATRLGPFVDQLAADLKLLDGAHQATSQLLHDTKLFMDSFHQTFETFEQDSEQRQSGNDRRFERVDSEFGELGRTLKEMRDHAQLETERLNGTNSSLQPIRHRLEQLEVAREEGRRRQNETERAVTDLRVHSKSMGLDVAKLIDFYEEAKRGEDLFEVVGALKRDMSKTTDNVNGLLETSRGHDDLLQKDAQRLSALEKAQFKMQEQANKLQERVGISDVPTARSATPIGASEDFKDYKEGTPASKMPLSVLRAVEKMSLTARQKRAIDQINEHTRELASTTNSLSQTACQLDSTELRVTQLEKQLEATTEELKKLNQGLDLTQEYWKGLSKGLRETNRSVNVEGEVLPPKSGIQPHAPSTKLPVISSRPSSRQRVTPCIMTAR